MAPVIAQMSPASQGEGQLLKHPLRDGPLSLNLRTPRAWGAAVAVRIFTEFANGKLPRRIVSDLNRESIDGPQGTG